MRPTPKVLIIDDSTVVHRFLDGALVDEGLELFHAFDGNEGLAQAKKIRPDMILLDIVMPAVSGFEICTRLKEDATTSQIPVIFLSAVGDVFNKVQGLDLGAVDFVVKPFEAAELQARVRAALRTKRLVDMLSELADVDALTGLWNRSHFDKCLVKETELQEDASRPLTLLMMDIDYFKQCNDRFGHPFGDRVLQAVAGSMLQVLRTSDVTCRFGGDEFAVILPDTGLAEAIDLAERLRVQIGTHSLNYRGQQVAVTISGGLASLPSPEKSTETPATILVHAADSALYRAKSRGRNCVLETVAGDAVVREYSLR